MTVHPAPLIHPSRSTLPVIVSVPHSGRDYSPRLLGNARAGRTSLAALEDPLVDRLLWRVLSRGTGAVIARAPRALIDCNRAEHEIDPAVVSGAPPGPLSARARNGLGIIPARTARHGHLWTAPVGWADFEARLEQVHRPFHGALAALVEESLETFGCALLLDCHSMPPAKGVADIVIGDRHGRSAGRWLSALALATARDGGFSAALNDPYAGGHVLDRHGRPERRVHALQIEVARSAYLDPSLSEPGAGFDEIARLLDSLASRLGHALLDRQPDRWAAVAAE